MKKLVLALFALALAASAAADVTYTVTVNDANGARVERARVRTNTATCAASNLPANCTQPQARVLNPTAVIYNTAQEYIDKAVVGGYVQSLKDIDTSDDRQQAKAAWDAKTAAQKDAACATFGLPAGCEIWPR